MRPIKELRILSELDRRLDGKCSDELHTCPSFIEGDLYEVETYCDTEWDCVDCNKMFAHIQKLTETEWDSLLNTDFIIQHCPCSVVEEGIALARLEERIDELIELLKGE